MTISSSIRPVVTIHRLSEIYQYKWILYLHCNIRFAEPMLWGVFELLRCEGAAQIRLIIALQDLS